jgi:hypothetical protein
VCAQSYFIWDQRVSEQIDARVSSKMDKDYRKGCRKTRDRQPGEPRTETTTKRSGPVDWRQRSAPRSQVGTSLA